MFKSNSGVDGYTPAQRPGVLNEKGVIVTSCLSHGAVIEYIQVAVGANATRKAGQAFDGCAIGGADSTLGFVGDRGSWQELNVGCVEVLVEVVGKTVQVVTELEVVRTLPAALEPRQRLIELNSLVGVTSRVVRVLRHVEGSVPLLQLRGQRSAVDASGAGLRASNPATGKEVDGAGRGIAKVVIVLEVIAEASGGHQARRDSEVCADVGGDIGSHVAQTMGQRERRDSVTDTRIGG